MLIPEKYNALGKEGYEEMNEEVMKVIKDTDPIAIMNELEKARRKAVDSLNRPGTSKEDSSVSAFYDLYFRSIVKPVMEHFTGEVKNTHEKGALYARVNEVFRLIYGRDVAPTFERISSEDHLSGTYKGVAFDQADVVVSKGKEENIFSGRAIQYSFATGIMGKIVIMEKGTFEGIGGGEVQAQTSGRHRGRRGNTRLCFQIRLQPRPPCRSNTEVESGGKQSFLYFRCWQARVGGWTPVQRQTPHH
jgi:hypothetical protein